MNEGIPQSAAEIPPHVALAINNIAYGNGRDIISDRLTQRDMEIAKAMLNSLVRPEMPAGDPESPFHDAARETFEATEPDVMAILDYALAARGYKKVPNEEQGSNT